MESLVLSPYHKWRLNMKLNWSFNLSQECNLNQLVWNFLVSTKEVICLIGPCCSPEEGDLALNNQLFARITSLFCLLLPVKSSILYSSSELFPVWYMGCCLIHELLNKANKRFKIYPAEFCYLTYWWQKWNWRRLLMAFRSRRNKGVMPCKLFEFSVFFTISRVVGKFLLVQSSALFALKAWSSGFLQFHVRTFL